MRVSPALVACALGATMALGGCSLSLPDTGDPQAFTLEAPTGEPIGQSAFGPRYDSDPDDLVLDFLRACAAGTSDNYATARQYLLPAVANSWDPAQGVIVYPTDRTPVPAITHADSTAATLTLKTQVRASLDGQGVFSAAADSEAQVGFELKKNAQGQWRISDLEDGILLSQAQFQSVFQPAQLYFLATDRESLVPDPRWYPKTRIASHLIEGLVAGPSSQLAPAVHSALGDSLWLPTQGVEIEDGQVRVDLVGDAPEGEAIRNLISLQVNATLSQLPNINDVEMKLNSVAVPNAEVPLTNRALLDSAVGIRSGALVETEGDNWTRVLSAEEMGADPHLPVGSPVQAGFYAWLGSGGVLRLKSEDSEVKEFDVEANSSPVIDRWGWVWTTSDRNPGVALAFNTDGNSVEVPLDDAGAHIDKLVISPDGVRVAYLKRGEAGVSASLAVLVRSGDGTPRSFDQSVVLTDSGNNVRDITWAGALNLMTLEGNEEAQMVTVPLSGFRQSSTLPADDIVRVTAGAQPTRVFLQADDQTLYTRVGAMWRRLGASVADVRFPG